MPLYDYRCENGHVFEVKAPMDEEFTPTCPEEECEGVEVTRIFSPPAVHFKGTGFYNTDYGKSR